MEKKNPLQKQKHKRITTETKEILKGKLKL